MDAGTLALLIPVLALATGLIAVARMPRKLFKQRADPELRVRLEALEEEIERLRRDFAEVQERLDFAERMLARADENRRLAGET